MKLRLFVAVEPVLLDDNFDYEMMTEAEIKTAEEQSDSVYEYLTERQQNWFEVACSETNLAKLEKLCKAMKHEIDGR